MVGCLSVYSYIKPQPLPIARFHVLVVYLSIPTSNHNTLTVKMSVHRLFICLFLHQTTTTLPLHHLTGWLFICLFLHQTTTLVSFARACSGCLSVYSYIKPQPLIKNYTFVNVVYLSIPTSNHNQEAGIIYDPLVVYLSIPTSNHNSVCPNST